MESTIKLPTTDSLDPASYSLKALDRSNFFLADIGNVFAPYLFVYLKSNGWSATQIGLITAATDITGMMAQVPVGALIDALPRKRALIACALAAIGLSYLVMSHHTSLPIVMGAQAAIGAAVVVIAPVKAAISLGITGYEGLEKRLSRNEAFNHSGSVAAAIAAAFLAHFCGLQWTFYFLVLLCGASIFSIFQIREHDINHQQARTAAVESGESLWTILSDRRLLILALCVSFFHFGNAALLPLMSQQLSSHAHAGLYVSCCAVVALLTMIPISHWAGEASNRWGRKPLLLAAFGAVVLRAILYVFIEQPTAIVCLQLLSGIASGLFGVVFLLMVVDLTKGKGCYGLVQGAISICIGIGSALSNLVASWLVEVTDYSTGYFFLAAVTAFGFVLFWSAMPETYPSISQLDNQYSPLAMTVDSEAVPVRPLRAI
ncbi:MAG: MFS transporter [Cyanophyceae cyanobacterium]